MSRRKLRVVPLGEFAQWLLETMEREKLRVRPVAAALNVTPKSVHEWLRGKGPLHPNHVKAELLQKLGKREKRPGNDPGSVTKSEAPSRGPLSPVMSEAAADRVARLPPAYRERYQTRAKEITLWAVRELDEYLKVLETDHQVAQKRKKKHE